MTVFIVIGLLAIILSLYLRLVSEREHSLAENAQKIAMSELCELEKSHLNEELDILRRKYGKYRLAVKDSVGKDEMLLIEANFEAHLAESGMTK